MISGKIATGPLIKIAQNMLNPDNIPYKRDKNIVEFCRLKMQNHTESTMNKVIVFSSILFASIQEVMGVTTKSTIGNQVPDTG